MARAKIGFIGGGNMAEAIIKGVIASKLYRAEHIHVSDIKKDRLDYLKSSYNINSAEDNSQLIGSVDTIILSVKPQNFNDLLGQIKPNITADKLIISIAAGITTGKIQKALGDIPIIRVMPNTAALVAEGAAAIFANDFAKPMLAEALAIFSSIGKAVIVEDEDLIDAVTAVSGSGPAYFFLLMEEMIKTAQELGLPMDIAKLLVIQTAKGAGLLAEQSTDTVAQLREKVTSLGGTTQAALKVFSEKGFTELINSAIKAARDRSIELSEQSNN